MAMTAMVKSELSRLECPALAERTAELATLLRFAGGLRILGGRVVIEAELDTVSVARRLRRAISEIYGYSSGISVLADPERRGVRHLVRIAKHGEGLARQTGLVDRRGRPVRGLPPAVVSGGAGVARAVWRGAFLARGILSATGRSSVLEVPCPTPEAAMALVGAGRRLPIAARVGELRGTSRVLVRDEQAIGELLAHMGARDAMLAWTERRMHRADRSAAKGLTNFHEANRRRSSLAAAATCARVQRALEIVGADTPEHMRAIARLRLEDPHASLEQLGKKAEPPMSKDAVAGRIRRLLVMADMRAHHLGIPDTGAAVIAEGLASKDDGHRSEEPSLVSGHDSETD